MTEPRVEHINITVQDSLKTAQMLAELFDWDIRWQGDAIYGGVSVHVGGKDSYVALYTHPERLDAGFDSYTSVNGFNHLGIVVDDLDGVEKKVLDAGYTPHSHGDYEPGRRFYFDDSQGLTIEVISYAPGSH